MVITKWVTNASFLDGIKTFDNDDKTICTYYAGTILSAFATYHAHNYTGIIGSSLLGRTTLEKSVQVVELTSQVLYLHSVNLCFMFQMFIYTTKSLQLCCVVSHSYICNLH